MGTSGYSYSDWVGPFYPPGTAKTDYLEHYARQFDTVELNFTYYRMPDPRTLARMQDKVPPGFVFVVKAHKSLTHSRDAGPDEIRSFNEALAPLREAGSLGALLLQFPHSFANTPASRNYLDRLAGHLACVREPIVVELRNSGWVREATFDLLKRLDLGFCCVDEPDLRGLMPRAAVVTSKTGYLRLHGRNSEKWWNHDEAWERYDHRYVPEELDEWIPRVRRMDQGTETTFVFANNHFEAKAVEALRLLQEMLASRPGRSSGGGG